MNAPQKSVFQYVQGHPPYTGRVRLALKVRASCLAVCASLCCGKTAAPRAGPTLMIQSDPHFISKNDPHFISKSDPHFVTKSDPHLGIKSGPTLWFPPEPTPLPKWDIHLFCIGFSIQIAVTPKRWGRFCSQSGVAFAPQVGVTFVRKWGSLFEMKWGSLFEMKWGSSFEMKWGSFFEIKWGSLSSQAMATPLDQNMTPCARPKGQPPARETSFLAGLLGLCNRLPFFHKLFTYYYAAPIGAAARSKCVCFCFIYIKAARAQRAPLIGFKTLLCLYK